MPKPKTPSRPLPEGPAHEPMTEAELHAFLADPATRRLAVRVIGRRVPEQEAEDLAHEAIAESKDATRRPRRGNARAWFAQICRWRAARWLERRRFEAEYVEPFREARHRKDEAGYDVDDDDDPLEDVDPRHDPERDPSFRGDAMLLKSWVAKHLTDPEKRQTFEWMCEWAEGEKTYADIAADNGITLQALNKRVERLKLEIREPFRRWRNGMFLLFLLGGAALVAVVVALLLFLRGAPPDEMRPDPAFQPLPPPSHVVPSPSAPPIAEPTQPAVDAGGGDKPRSR